MVDQNSLGMVILKLSNLGILSTGVRFAIISIHGCANEMQIPMPELMPPMSKTVGM